MVKLKRKLFLARKNWRTLTLVFAGAFLGIGLIVGGISLIGHLVFAAPTEPVTSISLTSQHTSFASNTPGAWNVSKSAKWTSVNTAKITFEVDTVAKIADNVNYDIIFVADISGSMSGDKLAQVKADASELTESLLGGTGNRIALVSFESSARIESGFTSDKNLMLQKINALSETGNTNYYDGFVKAGEVLEGYTQQPNRELILLFLTDGYPNEGTPNEVGQYELLKAKYPYMIINGIQYEMGTEVLSPIKAVSDNQYIATMTNLNNTLFEASVAPYTYDEFILTDFINDEFFSLGDISNISADKGTFSLSYDGDTPKVTWDLSGLRSGSSAHITINVTLKDGQFAEDKLYPTNKSTTVKTTLTDTPSENIVTDNTPVLKNDYDVIYDPNTPSGCTVTGMPATLTESHRIFETVALTDAKPACTGYNFAGFDTPNTGLKWLNDDFFIMPGSDVTLRATWTKVSMEKSMDGAIYETKTATFNQGYVFNAKIKQLAGQSDANYNTKNTNIVAFKRADWPSQAVDMNNNTYILSSPDSQVPIYGWYDDGDSTIYYYTAAENVAAYNLNYFFRNLESLTDISGLSGLDTSSVNGMSMTFENAKSLTDISVLSDWDTSNVTSMDNMFYNAESLTDISVLSDWDTSNVTNMISMFYGAKSLSNISALSNWSTSNVTNMRHMFYNAESLTDISALSNWNTSSVTNMSYMFYNAKSLSNITALSNWSTSNVTDMRYMFYNAKSLSNISALSNWSTSNVTNMNGMFYGAESLTDISALSNWNTSNVTDMSYMFYNAKSLTNISALSNWSTSHATTMRYLFGSTAITNVSALSNWSTSNVTNMDGMFYDARSLTDISALSNWDTSQVTNMNQMFSSTNISDISALSGWDTSSVTDMGSMFLSAKSLSNISALSNWSTSNVTNMRQLFRETRITSISPISGWDTSSVTNMSYMFYYVYSLSDISALSGWDTSSVTNMSCMFYFLAISDISALSNWDTSSVTNMGEMFRDAGSLTDISALSNWNTSNVTDMNRMFYRDSRITSLTPLNNWNTSNLTNKTDMFYGIPDSVTRPSWY